MKKTIHIIDSINQFVGEKISWLTTLLVLVVCIDVLMRYFFSYSQIWMMELEIYLYSFIFLLGSGYALKHDNHVRVDLFYSKCSDRNKAIIDLLGACLFLLPWTIIIVLVSSEYAWTSFRMNESSSQPSGLPAIYILKSSICIGFFLLFLQGVSSILKSILFLSNKVDTYPIVNK